MSSYGRVPSEFSPAVVKTYQDSRNSRFYFVPSYYFFFQHPFCSRSHTLSNILGNMPRLPPVYTQISGYVPFGPNQNRVVHGNGHSRGVACRWTVRGLSMARQSSSPRSNTTRQYRFPWASHPFMPRSHSFARIRGIPSQSHVPHLALNVLTHSTPPARFEIYVSDRSFAFDSL